MDCLSAHSSPTSAFHSLPIVSVATEPTVCPDSGDDGDGEPPSPLPLPLQPRSGDWNDLKPTSVRWPARQEPSPASPVHSHGLAPGLGLIGGVAIGCLTLLVPLASVVLDRQHSAQTTLAPKGAQVSNDPARR